MRPVAARIAPTASGLPAASISRPMNTWRSPQRIAVNPVTRIPLNEYLVGLTHASRVRTIRTPSAMIHKPKSVRMMSPSNGPDGKSMGSRNR
jgi:hypothetical protein